MITQESIPEIGCLSWIRAYHTGIYSELAPRDLLQSVADSGVDLSFIDEDQLQFFDIQTLREGHVARAKLPPVTLTGTVDLGGSTRQLRASVMTHVLLHQSGFMLIRPLIRFDHLQVEGGMVAADLHLLERGAWTLASPLTWDLPGTDLPLHGYVRNYMNWVFLDMFNRWSGDGVSVEKLIASSADDTHGCSRLQELVAEGRLEYAYPVSFGTEIQLAVPLREGEAIDRWRARADMLARDLMRPQAAGATVDTPPRDLEADAPGLSWYVDENMSVLIRSTGTLDDTMDLVDVDRGQVTEFLALRRGALTSVQRSTQRVITQRIRVSRQDVGRWQQVVATLTDDYIVHIRIGALLEPMKLAYAGDPRLRDLNSLEQQVRANLEWFQARIEATAEWTGGLVGAAVGAAALALSLTEPVRIVLAAVTGTAVDDVADRYGLALAGSITGVVLLSFLLSFLVVRRLSSTLKPVPGRRRRPSVPRRRRRRAPVLPR